MAEKKFYNKLVFKKYRILRLLGKGSFGFVFEGVNEIDKAKVAVKVEDWKSNEEILESEAYILYYLKGLGIPEVISFGKYGKYKILVENLLGDSLNNIFIKLNKIFTLKDICMIAIQIIDRFKYIHSKYIIHRDIKPDNISVDYETNKIINIIDFGLAKKYRSSRTGKHIKFSKSKKVAGTVRFASTNSLSGKEQSRRDDLESIGYVLIYFAKKGLLPWQGLKEENKIERYKQISNIKKVIKPESLCSGLPEEFCDYIKYVKGLQFEENPNYDYLKGLFMNIMNKMNYKIDLNFSWLNNKKIKKKNNNFIKENNYKIKNSSKRRLSPKTRIYRNILNCREKENNINKKNINDNIEEKQEKRESIFLIKKIEEILNKDKIKEEKRIKYNDNLNKENITINISEKSLKQITKLNDTVDFDNQLIKLQKYKKIFSQDFSQNKNKNEEKDINKINIEENNNSNSAIINGINDINDINNISEPIVFNKINESFNSIIDNNKESDIKKQNNHNNSGNILKFSEDNIQNVDVFSIKTGKNRESNNIDNIEIIEDNLDISNDFVENNVLNINRNYKNNFNKNNKIITSLKKTNIQINKNKKLKKQKLLNYRNRTNRSISAIKNCNLKLQKINVRKHNLSNNGKSNSDIELKTISQYSDNNIIRQLFNSEEYIKFQNYNSSNAIKYIPQTPFNYNNNIDNYNITSNDYNIKKKENQQKIEINLVNKTIPTKTKKVSLINTNSKKKKFCSFNDISAKNNSKSLKGLDNINYSKNINNKNKHNIINFNYDTPEIKFNNIKRTININKQLNQENSYLKKLSTDVNSINVKKKLCYNKLNSDTIYKNSYINQIEDNFNFSYKYLIEEERYSQLIPKKLIYSSIVLNNDLKINNNNYIPYNKRNSIHFEYNNSNINLDLYK